ncbi:response regulator [Clostridium sp. AM58-1XD]|uniref:response regulator n=1 Tax=Clostridium sp. AM58-1XD TaxID=2292307 RepID=UPI000E5137F9|nr:response regulator [Clostridium sp. AM58-1XD]RGY97968.1 response regulator [Clostridium sp. AM58-1XD]
MLKRKPVVLLIEDNENVNAANRQLLEREGYTVRIARSIAEAKRHTTGEEKVALLDIDLPDSDGLSFLPELCHLTDAVLVLSGNKEAAAMAVEGGAQGFIGKPYRLDELCRKVRTLVEPENAATAGRTQACQILPAFQQTKR